MTTKSFKKLLMSDGFDDSGSANSDRDFKDFKEPIEAPVITTEADLEINKYECPSGHELKL
jgi:hypothetical protein